MEENEKIIERTKVEAEGPNGASIFHLVTTKDEKVFVHILGCPLLKETREILKQTERYLSQKNLEKDISLFQEILEVKSKRGI